MADFIRNVWKKVRNKEEDTLEYLLKNNYIEMQRILFHLSNKNFEDMKDLYLELLGEYIDSTTKIPCKCKKCGHEWSMLPGNI